MDKNEKSEKLVRLAKLMRKGIFELDGILYDLSLNVEFLEGDADLSGQSCDADLSRIELHLLELRDELEKFLELHDEARYILVKQ